MFVENFAKNSDNLANKLKAVADDITGIISLPTSFAAVWIL